MKRPSLSKSVTTYVGSKAAAPPCLFSITGSPLLPYRLIFTYFLLPQRIHHRGNIIKSATSPNKILWGHVYAALPHHHPHHEPPSRVLHHSCYKRIFSFGDSIIDTGNFAGGKGTLMEFPYGMTYFKRGTGRICDGRVLVDFYAQALQLPLLPPNLPEKDTGLFPNGANFAVSGSTAMPPDYFRKWNHGVPTWCHLDMQMGWFKHLLHRISPDDGAKRRILSESLIVLGEIGGNDYNYWFFGRKPREQAAQFIPDIMAKIGSSIQELIGMGAKVIVIPNNFPIGCVPATLSSYRSGNPADYDEHGCLRWFNDFSQRHNGALHGVVDRLNAQNPHVKLIYADYYGATMQFIRDPNRFGIGNPLTACCGGDQQPYHTGKDCNKMARIWGDPRTFASWDGMHMTEKAYEVIAQGVLNGPFANPPLLRSC